MSVGPRNPVGKKPGFDLAETRLGKNRVSTLGKKPGFSEWGQKPGWEKTGFRGWGKKPGFEVGEKTGFGTAIIFKILVSY